MRRPPDELRSSMVGFANAFGKKGMREGQIARTITVLFTVQVMKNPPISALSPVSTSKRVEIFPNVPGAEGFGVGVMVGVADGVGVGVIEGVPAAVAVEVGVAVTIGVPVAVAVGVPLAVAVAVAVG